MPVDGLPPLYYVSWRSCRRGFFLCAFSRQVWLGVEVNANFLAHVTQLQIRGIGSAIVFT